MPNTRGKKPTADEAKELGEAVRDTALNQMADGLRSVGVSDDEIATARALCVEQNSDKPFVELFRKRVGR